MPTAALAARSGLIALSTGASASSTDYIAELRDIRLQVRRDQIEATSNDSSGWAEFIQGTASWTGTFGALYVPSSANVQFVVRNFLSSGSTSYLAFLFQPSTAASNTYAWTGTAVIRDYDLGGETNGAFMTNGSIQGSGALTFSTST